MTNKTANIETLLSLISSTNSDTFDCYAMEYDDKSVLSITLNFEDDNDIIEKLNKPESVPNTVNKYDKNLELINYASFDMSYIYHLNWLDLSVKSKKILKLDGSTFTKMILNNSFINVNDGHNIKKSETKKQSMDKYYSELRNKKLKSPLEKLNNAITNYNINVKTLSSCSEDKFFIIEKDFKFKSNITKDKNQLYRPGVKENETYIKFLQHDSLENDLKNIKKLCTNVRIIYRKYESIENVEYDSDFQFDLSI